MPLILIRVGELRKIINFTGSEKIKKRINAMGLNIGDDIKIMSMFHGNFIIVVKNSKIAISKEVAASIQVL